VSAPDLGALRWRCRRGMRELDLLLEGHLARHGALMNDVALACFERLLEQTDMDLYHWFTGRGRPTDAPLAALIDTIRRERHSL